MSKPDYPAIIAWNLKRFRRERRISRARLAERSGVSIERIKELEKGEAEISDCGEIASLAFALRLPTSDLWRPPKTLARFRICEFRF